MSRPLFEVYPRLASKIPYLPLADLPTPVASLSMLSPNLWVKRDDQTSGLYGGNKVRKLEFILAKMKQNNQQRLVTFGATGTNHGVATSLFCQQQGIDCSVLLFDQPVTSTVKQNLRLMHRFGASLKYCGSLWRTVLAFYLGARLRNSGAFFLFAGGSNIEGCIGFVNAAFELKQQIDQGVMPIPQVIYCPVGSSSTVAGLTLGCLLAGLPTKVVGVRVAPSHLGIFPACTPGTIYQLMRKTYHYMRRLDAAIPELPLPRINLDEGYYGRGYGMATEKGNEATTRLGRVGISLEPTYTAKAAAAALDYSDEHPSSHVLYWHTYNSVDMSALAGETEVDGLTPELRGILS